MFFIGLEFFGQTNMFLLVNTPPQKYKKEDLEVLLILFKVSKSKENKEIQIDTIILEISIIFCN